MSNNKQSSVEWLAEQFESCKVFSIKDVLEQAKAMHKEEITQAWKKGDGEFDNVAKQMSLDYYNETFGGEE